MATRKSRPEAASAEAGRQLASAIVRRHFGRSPRGLAPLGGGVTNDVFVFSARGERCVLRINRDASKIQDFLKEQWAMNEARSVGVPTPEVLEVGNDPVGAAFMILRHERGITPCDHPERLDVLRQLGELCARLHGVATHGFGKVFDWSANRLSQRGRWAEFVDVDLAAADRIALLERHAMLTERGARELRAALAEMRRWRKRPVLQHGDLRLKNVLVDPKTCRIAALVDWEHCLSAPPPYWDLSVALHDLGVDEKEALLEGYGLVPKQYEGMAPHFRALNLLNYAPVVEAAARDGDKTRLAWLQIRLRGALDLGAP